MRTSKKIDFDQSAQSSADLSVAVGGNGSYWTDHQDQETSGAHTRTSTVLTMNGEEKSED